MVGRIEVMDTIRLLKDIYLYVERITYIMVTIRI